MATPSPVKTSSSRIRSASTPRARRFSSENQHIRAICQNRFQKIRKKIPYKGLKVDLDGAQGLYLCRTAGDNVLHAKKTRPCEEVQRMNDIIIGTLDPVSCQLRVTMRSSY